MNPGDKHQRTANPEVTKEELEEARKVVKSLLLTRKNYSLYPEGHASILNSIDQLSRLLGAFLLKFESLRLDIEKDELLYQGEVVHSSPMEEGSLPFIFFRDGVRWIEFVDGIDSAEMTDFLKIIIRYSTLSEEPDGDIVTSFWEIQLPHIRYEVADFFWGSDQESESLPAPDLDGKEKTLPEKAVPEVWEPFGVPPVDWDSIVLTGQEKDTIGMMVDLEERGDPTGYLDALLDSLLQDREQGNFETILEVLEEEFKGSLPRKDFDVSLKILLSLQEVSETCSAEKSWVVPLLEDFALTLSNSQSLGPLRAIWGEIDQRQMDKVRGMLGLLQPESISTLGLLLVQNQSPRLRQILVDGITLLARQNFTPLDLLLKDSDLKLTEKLVPVLVNIQDERSSEILRSLIRHPSALVRHEALKELLKRGTVNKKEIFSLIDDKDESFRGMILKIMGQARNEEAEDFLLHYLKSPRLGSTDSEHVIACYLALGKCGSSRSIPFLRETLLQKGRFGMFGMSAHREGAAAALGAMDGEEARKVLERAAGSLIPSIRRAARKAR